MQYCILQLAGEDEYFVFVGNALYGARPFRREWVNYFFGSENETRVHATRKVVIVTCASGAAEPELCVVHVLYVGRIVR